MKRRSLFAALFLCATLFSASARQQPNSNPIGSGAPIAPIAIVGATVIDGTGAEPQLNTVVIRGDRIETVAPKVELPAGTQVIDARGMTLMPGLFDLHTHLPYATGGNIAGDWPKNLKAYLYCGVTSVVDFGTYPETFEPMRRLIKTGAVEGPRISLAVRMTTPGGHGAEGGRGDFFSLEVSTPAEARAAVRGVLKYQPDVVKVFTDGWRYGAAPDMSSMNEETLTSLVDEAHKNGLEVLTHTVTLDKAKIAARAGVDVIAHSIGDHEVDEEIGKLMKAGGTTYAATLAVYEPRSRDILSSLLAAALDPAVRNRINPPLVAPGPAPLTPGPGSIENGDSPRLRRWSVMLKNVASLRRAGVAFGTGTDAGVTGTHHGWATLRELQLLVTGGLTPLEAITAATGNAARALHVDGERGTIAPGKLADLILVDGAPHKNIADIERIKHLFLGGREIDREKLTRDIASPALSPMPAIKARELIDDFESANGRTAIDTLVVNATDPGADPSKMLFGRVPRDPGNHALSITTRMALKERSYARIVIPLSRGAVEPVDAREFRGVKFDVRGDGEHRLLVPTYGVRNSDSFQAPFKAIPQWRTVSIEFSSLKQNGPRTPVKWTGDDLLMLSFEIARPAGSFGWLELDNVRFYR